MCLGDNIRYLRTKYGYSQDKLAELLGYKSFTTIQKWESGISEPPIKKLKELAKIFDTDMDDMANINLANQVIKPFDLVYENTEHSKFKMDSFRNRAMAYYLKLNPENKQKVYGYIESLARAQEYEDNLSEDTEKPTGNNK